MIGAQRPERFTTRRPDRTGDCSRRWTHVCPSAQPIPTLRRGRDVPRLREPRRAERALLAVVPEAAGHGGSTRKVDALVQAPGIAGLRTSAVSRLWAARDEPTERLRNRSRAGRIPPRGALGRR